MEEQCGNEVSHWLVDVRPREKRCSLQPQTRRRRRTTTRREEDLVESTLWMLNLAENHKHVQEVDVSNISEFDLGNEEAQGLAMCSHQGLVLLRDRDKQFVLGNPLDKSWEILPGSKTALANFQPTVAAISSDSKFLLVSNVFKSTAVFSLEKRTWTVGVLFEPWIAGSKEDRERRMNPSSDPLLMIAGNIVWAASAFYACMSRRRRGVTFGMQWEEACLVRYDMEMRMWREAEEVELPAGVRWSEVTEMYPLSCHGKLLVYIHCKAKEECCMTELVEGGKLVFCDWFDHSARDKVWSLSLSSLCMCVLGEDGDFIWYATDTGSVLRFCLERLRWTEFECSFRGPCYLRTFGTWKPTTDAAVVDEVGHDEVDIDEAASGMQELSSAKVQASPGKQQKTTQSIRRFLCCFKAPKTDD